MFQRGLEHHLSKEQKNQIANIPNKFKDKVKIFQYNFKYEKMLYLKESV